MNIKIDATIKRLRNERQVTQDMPATSLGMTPQAISRWESEGGYPDLEMLPVIADFFSVTIDELLGHRPSEREAKLTDCLGIAIMGLVLSEDLPNDPSTWDKKIEMLSISERLYPLIYGENLLFYHVRMSRIAWLLSTYQIAQGNEEAALDSLGRMAAHAVAYDEAKRHRHGEAYTSVLTNALVYPEPSADFHEMSEHNESYYKLDRLAHVRYDGIREDARFVQIVERLTASAE